MQSEILDETVPMIPAENPTTTAAASKCDLRIKETISKTKILLLVILAFQLILTVFDFIQRIISLVNFYRLASPHPFNGLGGAYIGTLLGTTVLLAYLVAFIVIIARSNRIGIYIFAWLAVFELIWLIIIFILAIIAIVTFADAINGSSVGLVLSIAILIASICDFILTILAMILAFRLTKLLRSQEVYQSI